VCDILSPLEWCLLDKLTFILHHSGLLNCLPTLTLSYFGCSGIPIILATFEWCLLGMVTFILLYSHLVDCWTQLTQYVIMASQASVASWLLLNDVGLAH
jgi:hypothetical protein